MFSAGCSGELPGIAHLFLIRPLATIILLMPDIILSVSRRNFRVSLRFGMIPSEVMQ